MYLNNLLDIYSTLTRGLTDLTDVVVAICMGPVARHFIAASEPSLQEYDNPFLRCAPNPEEAQNLHHHPLSTGHLHKALLFALAFVRSGPSINRILQATPSTTACFAIHPFRL